MPQDRDEARDDILAMLAAHRELPPGSDADLADTLLARLRAESVESPVARPNLQARLGQTLARIPVTGTQVLTAVVAQGAATGLMALVIIHVFGIDTDNDHWVLNAAPLWDALAVLWLLEVAVTLALLAWLHPRPEANERVLRPPHLASHDTGR